MKIIDIDLDRRRISLSIKQAAEGGVVAAEYQDHFGEHAYDEQGNYIGPAYDEAEAEASAEEGAEAGAGPGAEAGIEGGESAIAAVDPPPEPAIPAGALDGIELADEPLTAD